MPSEKTEEPVKLAVKKCPMCFKEFWKRPKEAYTKFADRVTCSRECNARRNSALRTKKPSNNPGYCRY